MAAKKKTFKKLPSRKGILKRLEKAMDKIGASKATVGYTFAEARKARKPGGKGRKRKAAKAKGGSKRKFSPKKVGSWGGKGKGKARGRKRDSKGRFI